MFLSKLQSLLGSVPVGNRSYPDLKRRYRRRAVATNDAEFFGSSGFEIDLDQARRREVNKLFTRMRTELQDISIAFQEAADDYLSCLPPCRQGLLIQMLVASEFVADELDHLIARLCLAGNEAEKRGMSKQIEAICESALTYAKLRKRFNEFQHELDSMLLVLIHSGRLESPVADLNFDPMVQEKYRGRIFVQQFLNSIDQSISALTELASEALKNRDFEIAAQLCSCNVQLAGFLDDARKILAKT